MNIRRYILPLKFFLLLILTIVLVIVGSVRIGLVPPVGKLLDPFHGFWQNLESERLKEVYTLNFDGLQAPVTILIDDRLVETTSQQEIKEKSIKG